MQYLLRKKGIVPFVKVVLGRSKKRVLWIVPEFQVLSMDRVRVALSDTRPRIENLMEGRGFFRENQDPCPFFFGIPCPTLLLDDDNIYPYILHDPKVLRTKPRT